MDLDFQGVQALPAGAGDNNPEQTAAREGLHRIEAGHVKHVVPDAFPVVAMIGMGDGLFNERADCRRHGDMDTGEVLGRDLGQVAGAGVDQDAVGNGLGTGIDGNDHEAIQRMAGLMDNVAGLGQRITGDVTHGMWGTMRANERAGDAASRAARPLPGPTLK